MNKTIISAIAGVMLSTTAISAPLTDFFFANGYSQPQSIVKIQSLVNDGTYYNYPYIVGGGVEKGLFKDKLKDGTALPQITNVAALKAALDKKQVVLVANADGSYTGTLPIFAEIAKQNGVTGTELMAHLVTYQLDDEDFFSNIDDVLGTVQSKIDEISAELNDEVSEEISDTIAEEVTVEITGVIGNDIDTLADDIRETTTVELADIIGDIYSYEFTSAVDAANALAASGGPGFVTEYSDPDGVTSYGIDEE